MCGWCASASVRAPQAHACRWFYVLGYACTALCMCACMLVWCNCNQSQNHKMTENQGRCRLASEWHLFLLSFLFTKKRAFSFKVQPSTHHFSTLICSWIMSEAPTAGLIAHAALDAPDRQTLSQVLEFVKSGAANLEQERIDAGMKFAVVNVCVYAWCG